MSNTPIVDTPLSGDRIVNEDGSPTDQFQSLLISLQQALNTGKLNGYTVANVPDATQCNECIIYISDEAGGAVPAFSDGTNWRRVQDRVIIS